MAFKLIEAAQDRWRRANAPLRRLSPGPSDVQQWKILRTADEKGHPESS
jgi:hypothetical protein